MSRTVSCSTCGHPLDPDIADVADRDPCPQCGGSGIAVQIVHAVEDDDAGAAGISMEVIPADEIDVAGGLTLSQGPDDHERDAERRWRETAEEIQSLEEPLPSAETTTLLDAQRRLHAVFVELWALREAAIRGGAQNVDAAINQSPRMMALAHDLGNLAKHGKFRKPTRTGLKPDFGPPRAERPGSGGTWRFRLTIEHAGQPWDGVDLARKAIDEWEQHLRSWGLM